MQKNVAATNEENKDDKEQIPEQEKKAAETVSEVKQ